MNQETNLDKALEAIKNGEFVLVFDDDDREGEVDMIIASEFVTPKSIATMRNDAGGLICNCLHSDFCDAKNIQNLQNLLRMTFRMMKDHHFQYGPITENLSLV